MKILKYILLLLLLVFVTTSILVATLKPDFDISRSRIINAPKATVFNYINDYRNWEEFGSWKKDDASMKFIYPKNTIGKGSYYSWKGQDGEGKLTTVSLAANDSIFQSMNFNGNLSNVIWKFEDVKGKTKVTWRNVGKMNFVTKIFTSLFGGMDSLIGSMYEKSLANIDKNFNSQLNAFAIKVDGFQIKNIGFYLQKTIYSRNVNLQSNIEVMIPKLLKFVKDNKISLNGKPFVKYNFVNNATQITNFSVCVPIKDSLMISQNSEITFGEILPFQAIKITLNGDYTHKNIALNKAYELMSSNNLVQKTELPLIDIYNISKVEQQKAINWVTEIYIPVKLKLALKKIRIKGTYKSSNIN